MDPATLKHKNLTQMITMASFMRGCKSIGLQQQGQNFWQHYVILCFEQRGDWPLHLPPCTFLLATWKFPERYISQYFIKVLVLLGWLMTQGSEGRIVSIVWRLGWCSQVMSQVGVWFIDEDVWSRQDPAPWSS